MILEHPAQFKVLASEEYKILSGGRKPRTDQITLDKLGLAQHSVLVYDTPFSRNSPPRTYVCRLATQRLEEVVQDRGVREGLLTPDEYMQITYALNNGGGTIQTRNSHFSTAIIDELVDMNCRYVYHPDFDKPGFSKRNSRKTQKLPGWADGIEFVTFPEVTQSGKAIIRKSKKLKPQQERELFLEYNFTKYRLHSLMLPFLAGTSCQPQEINNCVGYADKLKALLTSANLPLVLSMAKRANFPNVSFSDIVAEGNEALLRAVDRFDISRGFRFSTYACRAILKAYHRLAEKTGKYYQHFPVGFDPELERSDHADKVHAEETEYQREVLRKVLKTNSARLAPIEKIILLKRFPLKAGKKRETLRSLGKLLGLSNETIRQVQNKALKKLRYALGRENGYLPPELRAHTS